ncbi:MAG: Transcription termination factor Rho [Candidatus Gottesmanbacteria bacterium GW2011_GWB1_44_11c]|uniref:Transcription termination factor Rho n=2 Tax=Candidatus Gottesmaniibacteriota TaxID=1752720 RepID=A0A0G1INE7_9BACT|nr:MAG: Transcription termination factor Rho [Candidatus Gottesmanbacteria bacterium GW2011_GWB1_44_11c]KKT60645.1 MAG: Transcription termination factor Rho [Candidatus Gottesmanbacteria bacterium GW2011_GWA1_44_24b]
MAYRATTKRSASVKSGTPSAEKSTKTTEEKKSSPIQSGPASPGLGGPIIEVPPTKAEELSVDALIGGPVSSGSVLPPEKKVEPMIQRPEITPTPPASPSPTPSFSYSEPRDQGYGPRSYQRYTRPSGYQDGSPGGYRGPVRGYGSGYDRGYRRPQRDFSQGENGVVQDIAVPTETVKGILDIMPEGHGFLRPKFTPSDRDVYISQSQIRRFLLRNGDEVTGQARPPKDNERYWGLLKVEKINGLEAEGMTDRPRFDDLIPIYPSVHLKLETGQLPLSTRIIDLLSPIGFGQRGLIVSPPKAGKTTILKEIASGISANYPNVHLMAALIGERPEEVTDLTRNIKGEVLSSNFDQSPSEQVRVAEVALDRAKRLVEIGKDVVILLDSITRLARAYNLVVNPSGRTLSGGFDPAALYPAKKFLGAARCIEATLEAGESPSTGSGLPKTNGSLTVIGTCLIDTGSRMDDLIYEEFKGTGNMELHLSRKLQERRIFPAIDIATSGTRHDELMIGEEAMKKIVTLRHMLALLSDDEQTAMMIERLSKTASNAEFVESLNQG